MDHGGLGGVTLVGFVKKKTKVGKFSRLLFSLGFNRGGARQDIPGQGTMVNCTIKTAHVVPLASARQHPENRKENQAGHSSEHAVEGQGRCKEGPT